MNVVAIAMMLLLQLVQIEVPQPVGFVNDFANTLPQSSEERIASIVQDVRAKSGGEIVVVTLTDLAGRAPVDVAREIGRQWRVGATGGPGDRARNTGVIILLVPKETSPDGRGYTQIATGTGSEGFITDATAGRIQDEAIPLLRNADYGRALELMTWRVAERFAREFQFQLDSTMAASVPRDTRAPRGSGGIPPILIIMLIFIVLSMMRGSRRGRRRGCGGGGCMPIFIPFPMGGGGWGGGGEATAVDSAAAGSAGEVGEVGEVDSAVLAGLEVVVDSAAVARGAVGEGNERVLARARASRGQVTRWPK